MRTHLVALGMAATMVAAQVAWAHGHHAHHARATAHPAATHAAAVATPTASPQRELASLASTWTSRLLALGGPLTRILFGQGQSASGSR